MDVLKNCADIYSILLNKKYIITLSNLQVITIVFKEEHFYHLIGLQYLNDIVYLRKNKKAIFKKIMNNEITFKNISNSVFVDQVVERINNFSYIIQLLSTDRIIKFDPKRVYSRINADYIMVKNNEGNNLMLFLGKNNNDDNLYPVSFIIRNNNDYIYGQKSIGIKDIQIIDFDVEEQVAAKK
jgi:hypothetical protein